MRWINLSEQKQTLEEFISILRNEVVLAHSRSEQVSLASFDKMIQQFQQFTQLLQTKEKEIKRLEELCNKNKIDTKPSQEVKTK